MSSVYLITEGEYSDYHIIGVFSTKEIAQTMIEYVGGEVEEFELDPGVNKIHQGRRLTYIGIRRDGSVTSIQHESGLDVGARLVLGFRSSPELQVKCWAKDFAHAVHIAGEMRRVLLAENLWPETQAEYDSHPFKNEFEKHLGAALDRAVEVVEGRDE